MTSAILARALRKKVAELATRSEDLTEELLIFPGIRKLASKMLIETLAARPSS